MSTRNSRLVRSSFCQTDQNLCHELDANLDGHTDTPLDAQSDQTRPARSYEDYHPAHQTGPARSCEDYHPAHHSHQTDLMGVSSLGHSLSQLTSQSRYGYGRHRHVSNLDLSHSPGGFRPGSMARDSGYNTDVSPATTISPATTSTRAQHFVFDDLDSTGQQLPEVDDKLPPCSPLPSYLTLGGSLLQPPPAAAYYFHYEQRSRSTPPLRVSPDIFRLTASPIHSARGGTRTSSRARALSESSETRRIYADFYESDNEEDAIAQVASRSSAEATRRLPPSHPRAARRREHCQHCHRSLHSPIHSRDSEEEAFFSPETGDRRSLVESPFPSVSTSRPSLSSRERRYLSGYENEDDDDIEDDETVLGACGGNHPETDSLSRSFSPRRGPRRRSVSESGMQRYEHLVGMMRNACSGSQLGGQGSFPSIRSESSLTTTSLCLRNHPSSSDSTGVFELPTDDPDSDEDIAQESGAETLPAPDRLTPTVEAGWGCLLYNAWGVDPLLLPWVDSSGRRAGVTVGTQTPHAASLMIQQIVDSPLPLPNEARGSAVGFLRRRQSDVSHLQSLTTRPLPDIVPAARERSMSVPDVQTMARIHRAREVGRELRRMSDQFHNMRALVSIQEEVQDRLPHFLSNPIANLFSLLRHTFRARPPRRRVISRRSSSVDLVGRVATTPLEEQLEDLPGD